MRVLNSLRVIVLVSLALVLQACQPAYTVEKTKGYARSLAVINKFEISRWHGRLLEADSVVAVVSDQFERVDGVALSKVVADGLSPYFNRVTGGVSASSIAEARTAARDQGAAFLMYLEMQSAESLVFDPEAPSQRSNYNEMQLIVRIVDVVSGKTIDKIQLTAKAAHFRLLGTDMNNLLSEPVGYIGRQLTGG